MKEEIKHYKKEYVFDNYTRIVDEFKDYEKITKTKMIDEIYKVYRDYKNILDICTTRELKFLRIVLAKEKNLYDDKYKWERNSLRQKYLIYDEFHKDIYIPEEIEGYVKEALNNVNWDVAKKLDEINELLIGYCKIQGSALLNVVANLFANILKIDEQYLITHMFHNKVFNYYVDIVEKESPKSGEAIPMLLFDDYWHLSDQLEEQRKIYGKASSVEINLEEYRTMFYNDFNINKPIIKKFLEKLNKLPFFSYFALEPIRYYALLNLERKSLKDSISSVPMLAKYDLTEFFILLDQAMDEMPSGALNGLTPNQYQKLLKEEKKIQFDKVKKYHKQENACLGSKEAKLFYKLYFAILDFTNQFYKIKPGYKIYKKVGVNPYTISDIVEKFWTNKDLIITEFCLKNPYKFSKEELKLVNEFKKGVRDTFIIAKYEAEYTAIMNQEKVYMIKGINSNIDEVIPYNELPYMTITAIMPFNGKLIYDGILQSYDIEFDLNFDRVVEKEYESAIKNYHL